MEASDQWHASATAAFAKIKREGARLLTTPWVLMECANNAARRPYRSRVVALRSELLNGGSLIQPTAEEVEQAWLAYDRGEADQASIVDHISFAVMRRLGLTEAFTNDHHFRVAGFVTLF